MLASRVVQFPMIRTHGLANMQIRMLFQLAIFIMNAGLLESALNLNCQKVAFDPDGNTAETMFLAVALCLTPKTNCQFFSR
jgi:hypothetical protein